MSEKVFEYIDSLEQEGRHIGCQEFEDYLHEHLPDGIDLEVINKILEFISNQCGYWYARWTFSPVSNPDTEAHSESELWDTLRQSFTKSLDDVYPEMTESMVKRHEAIKTSCVLTARVKYNESRPLERFATAFISRSAIVLNKIGFSDIANTMYASALFPKGTVGHGPEI